MSLLVLVAHNGKTLQLDVQPTTRVDAVQHALVSFTGIPVSDQIVMFQGARLDPAKALGAYRLPPGAYSQHAIEDQPVFLYCRSYLKPGAPLPPPEVLPPLQVQVPPLSEVNLTHPLHSAASPLVRALPDYERHFQHHLLTTRAYWEVAQARLQRCRQLLSEQEVQARAADAARANVEAHYNYILTSYQTFLDKYNAQHAAHALLLSTFPSDLAALEELPLHPSLQAEGCRVLGDLYPLARLREWHETCARSHASFGAKVAELEGLFQLLRKDVEALFMQAPSVDLDALGRQLAENEALLDEHSSMVQVLSKDVRTVKSLVEDVVRQLGAGGAGGGRQGGLHDAAAAMEAIHENHRTRVLPRLAQLDGQLGAFASAAEASKVAMTQDVLSQLQRISGQQSRIRDMKNKLAAFHEVTARQDTAFAELKAVHRLPSAYRALLAEAVRRGAWQELYSGQAARLAEHMSRFRDKERGRRGTFVAQVGRFLPPDLLARAGLASEPPHCQVTVPPPPVPLICVSMRELQQLSYLDERMAASALAGGRSMRASSSGGGPTGQGQAGGAPGRGAGSPGGLPMPPSPSAQGSMHLGMGMAASVSAAAGGGGAGPDAPAVAGAFPGTRAVLDADGPPPTSTTTVEMENARLRAELANHIAAACIRDLTGEGGAAAGPAEQPAAGAGQRPSAAGSASPTPSTSPPASAGVTAAARAAAAGAAAGQRRDPHEALAALQRALGMKDDLIHKQQREIAALAARSAAYEERIGALERLLADAAAAKGAGGGGDGGAGGGGAASGLSIGSGGGGGGGSSGHGPGAEQAASSWHEVGGASAHTGGSAPHAQPPVAHAAQGASAGAAAEEGWWAGLSAAPDAAAREGLSRSRAPTPRLVLGPGGEGAEEEQPQRAGGEGDGPGSSPPTPSSPFALPALQQQPLAGDDGAAAVEGGGGSEGRSSRSASATPSLGHGMGSGQLQDSPAGANADASGGGAGGGGAGPAGPSAAAAAAVGPVAIPVAPGQQARRRRGGRGHAAAAEQRPGGDVASLAGEVGGATPGSAGMPSPGAAVAPPVGSLPFATSLPSTAMSVGMSLPRMEGAPSGVGLGIALGFRLGSLAEQQGQQAHAGRGAEGQQEQGEQQQGEQAGAASSSSVAVARLVAGRAARAMSGSGVSDDEPGTPTTGVEAAGGGGGGGTSSSCSSGLQFQPSWSATPGALRTEPASASGAASGLSGEEAGGGSGMVERVLEAEGGEEAAGELGGGVEAGVAEPAGTAAGNGASSTGAGADIARAADGAARGAGAGTGGGDAADRGYGCDELSDGASDDVPDIDDHLSEAGDGGGGAGEAGPAAAAVQRGPGGHAGVVEERAGSAGAGRRTPGASSGYESVGSGEFGGQVAAEETGG